jgi:hypothetical protein
VSSSAGRARPILIVAAIALVSGALWIGWLLNAPRRVPSGQPPLAHLDAETLPALREAFNAHTDEVRLVVLLSPT